MSFQPYIHQLLSQIGPGHMLSTAYDTAWIARLVDLGEPMGATALEWLRENQLPDGTWGAREPHYFHDRLVSTLAAMTALGRYGRDSDKPRLTRALLGLDISIRGLRADTVGETVGFEMIAPTLLDEVKGLGLLRRQDDADLMRLVYPYHHELSSFKEAEESRRGDDGVLNSLGVRRIKKLQALSNWKINRYVTIAFSAEMVGTDGLHLLDVENLLEANGSVGHSPSATAHYALNVRRGDETALNYLRHTLRVHQDSGGAPDVAPFDTFERAWTLWNLSLTGALDDQTLELCLPHLDFLQNAWHPEYGVGFATAYTPKDGDDSGLIYDVLARYGRKMDISAILGYEKEDHFRCYALESNPSISANIHILGALFQAGYPASHPSVQKVVNFLHRTRYLDMFWFDKWHVSPYYPTTHAIIASEPFSRGLETSAVEWLISSQNPDGSWGYYTPSAEETAYCLQALLIWKRAGNSVPHDCLRKGLDWLAAHMEQPYLPMWIGKSLYCPYLVVRSAIISALMLGQTAGY